MSRAAARPLDLVVVPYDNGVRGARMGAGPEALLAAGLADRLADAGHDVRVVRVEATAIDPLESAMELAAGIARAGRAARAARRLPVVLAGNCMSTVGAFAGSAGASTGVVWFDAHGDLNTPETSASGFLDGMAAATLLGWCHAERVQALPGWRPLPPERLLLVGGRDLDPPEAAALRTHPIGLLTAAQVREAAALAGALDVLAARTDAIYLHLDLDVLDPVAVGPVNAFAAPGGLALADAEHCVAQIAARREICGITLSAYDPAVDARGAVPAAAGALVAAALRGPT